MHVLPLCKEDEKGHVSKTHAHRNRLDITNEKMCMHEYTSAVHFALDFEWHQVQKAVPVKQILHAEMH